MKVEKLMTADIGTCRPDDSGSVAAKIMWGRDCGTVPVVDEHTRVVGMVTDRDLCMASYLEGRPLHSIAVRRAMSKELWSCRPEDELSRAEKVMREHRIRRLPVTNREGELRGVLSLSDLSREAARESQARTTKIDVSYTDIGETLGEINVPNVPTRTAQAS